MMLNGLLSRCGLVCVAVETTDNGGVWVLIVCDV